MHSQTTLKFSYVNMLFNQSLYYIIYYVLVNLG